MQDFKGIYYGDSTEKKYYEGGAHFKYNDLYKALSLLCKSKSICKKRESIKSHNKVRNILNVNTEIRK